MEKSKDPVVYHTKEEWKELGMTLMWCQTSFRCNEEGYELYSNHQVKPT